MSWLLDVREELLGPACGSRSTNFAAASNSADHGIEVAVGARRAGPPAERGRLPGSAPRPVADHIAHSTDSALTPASQRTIVPSRRTCGPPRRRQRWCGPPGEPARPPRRWSRARSGRTRASASSSSLVRPPPSGQLLPAQRPPEPAQRDRVRAPDRGQQGVDGDLRVHSSRSRRGRGRGPPPAAPAAGAPRPRRAPAGRSRCRPPGPRRHQHATQAWRSGPALRTMTAMSDHGMPRAGAPRAARPRRRLASWDTARSRCTSTRPPARPGAGLALEAAAERADLGRDPAAAARTPAAAGMPWAARAWAHRRRGRSDPLSEVARVSAAEGLHRAVGVAEQHQLSAGPGDDPQQPRRCSGRSPGRRRRRRSRRPSRSRCQGVGSSSSRSAAAPRIQAGSYAPGADRAVTSSYSASTCAAPTHSGRPWVAPERREVGSASRPCSTARISRSRSSPRKPRVASAWRTRSGHAGPRLSPRRRARREGRAG